MRKGANKLKATEGKKCIRVPRKIKQYIRICMIEFNAVSFESYTSMKGSLHCKRAIHRRTRHTQRFNVCNAL